MPQKFLVWEDRNSQVHVTYNDPKHFGKRHGRQGLASKLAGMAIKLEEMANEGAGNAFADQPSQLYRYASAVPIQAANQTGALVLDPMVVLAPPTVLDPMVTVAPLPTPTVNPFNYIINHLATGQTVFPGLNTNFQSNGNGYSTKCQ